jgi:hypothetical protein
MSIISIIIIIIIRWRFDLFSGHGLPRCRGFDRDVYEVRMTVYSLIITLINVYYYLPATETCKLPLLNSKEKKINALLLLDAPQFLNKKNYHFC